MHVVSMHAHTPNGTDLGVVCIPGMRREVSLSTRTYRGGLRAGLGLGAAEEGGGHGAAGDGGLQLTLADGVAGGQVVLRLRDLRRVAGVKMRLAVRLGWGLPYPGLG